MTYDKTFSVLLNQQMHRKGVSSEHLANELKLSTTIVSFWRNAKRLPTPEVAAQIGEVLSINSDIVFAARFKSVIETVKQLGDTSPEHCKTELYYAQLLKENPTVLEQLGV